MRRKRVIWPPSSAKMAVDRERPANLGSILHLYILNCLDCRSDENVPSSERQIELDFEWLNSAYCEYAKNYIAESATPIMMLK